MAMRWHATTHFEGLALPLKILTAEISHESNTFNIHPTDTQDFRDRFWLDGPSACATRGLNNTELAGVLDVSRNYGWDLRHTISAAAGPGGRVTDRASICFARPSWPRLRTGSGMELF